MFVLRKLLMIIEPEASRQNCLARFIRHTAVVGAFMSPLSFFSEAHAQNEPGSKLNMSLDRRTAQELAAKVDEHVQSKFFDKATVDKNWTPAFSAAKELLFEQKTLPEFASKMNGLLALLHASHTQIFTENDESFYFMRSLFSSYAKDKVSKSLDADFTGLGLGGNGAKFNQVRYVLDGSPAAKAGFQRGDQILSIDSCLYTGYAAWNGSSQRRVKCLLKRQEKELELEITPVKADFLTSYVQATEKSARVINLQGKKFGYLHYWCGGDGAQEALESAVLDKLADTDGLVLDLRDGYGGASLDDLDVFFRPKSAYPEVMSQDRQAKHVTRMSYDRPIVVLTNRGTRSGKELMSFALKRSRRGRLFGERTAGFVLGGQYIPLNDRVMLYLAVVNISVDGIRLEGKGVVPDVWVADKLSRGDAVLEKGLEYLLKLTQRTNSVRKARRV